MHVVYGGPPNGKLCKYPPKGDSANKLMPMERELLAKCCVHTVENREALQ